MTKKRKATKKAATARSARRSKTPARMSERTAVAVATNPRRSVVERISAMAEAPLAATENEDSLREVLDVLLNAEENTQVRLAALQTLQAASFGAPAFVSIRGDFLAALRQVAEDPDPELRQRALGVLARAKDGFAQKKLIEGLRSPEKALVSPEKALQLLSYDVHAEAYPVARSIVSKPPNTAAKREALRLLAADAGTAPVFEKILRDKTESLEIRQTAAAALRALKPDKLQAYAREALLDPGESEQIQATSLTALTQFGDEATLADSPNLLKRAERLSAGAASHEVKQSARRFLSKYRSTKEGVSHGPRSSSERAIRTSVRSAG